MRRFPFRIGTTSYILPDEILPNVHYLADQVDDVELVLFEVDDGPNNLPDDMVRNELEEITNQHDLTFTVHLPLDLRLASDQGEQHISLMKAKKVIDCTRSLHPWAYVLHLDGREEKENPTADVMDKWNTQAVKALEIVAEWAGNPLLLAVENLDGYPPDFWDEVLTDFPANRCIDIGHLWKDGHDPVPYLEKNIGRALVLHIHGIDDRDHKSLQHVPPAELRRVMDCIIQSGYHGVMTIEVFGEEEFLTSMQAVSFALNY